MTDNDAADGAAPAREPAPPQNDEVLHPLIETSLDGIVTLRGGGESSVARIPFGAAREPAPPLNDAEFRQVVAPLLFVLRDFLAAEAPSMLALETWDPPRFRRWHELANETHRALSQIRGAARREAPEPTPRDRTQAAVMHAIELTIIACDADEKAKIRHEARSVDYAGILAASLKHAYGAPSTPSTPGSPAPSPMRGYRCANRRATGYSLDGPCKFAPCACDPDYPSILPRSDS